jgi:hypothetical protein
VARGGGRQLVPEVPEAGLSVSEVLLSYVEHCEGYYRTRDGDPDERTLWHNRRAVR